jgi:hypothetical protein
MVLTSFGAKSVLTVPNGNSKDASVELRIPKGDSKSEGSKTAKF